MRDEYDIKEPDPRRDHYADKLKRQIAINIGVSTIEYFKQLSIRRSRSYHGAEKSGSALLPLGFYSAVDSE